MSQSARLAPLDALRGIAAIGVAGFFHHIHFPVQSHPYPAALHWFYNSGLVFVDMFYVLSGVVFCYVYQDKLTRRQVSAREFCLLRFSRLYPLHLATLLYTAACQYWVHATVNDYWVHRYIDKKHFLYNILFLHGGFFEEGNSFNSPSNTVSSELFAYFLFFIIAARRQKWQVPLAVLALIFGIVFQVVDMGRLPVLNAKIARAVFGFFTGFFAYRVLHSQSVKTWMVGLWLAMGAGFVFWDYSNGYPVLWTKALMAYAALVFAPLIILVLRVASAGRLLSFRPLTFLGDISYSVYLIHFPIQLTMMMVVHANGWRPPWSDAWFFWFYLILLIPASWIMYSCFEKPAREWLRKKLIPKSI